MTLFLAVSAVVFSAIISLIGHQERMVAMQSMLNDSSYALEYMGRLIRMAQKDLGGTCITAGRNYEVSGSTLSFMDHDGMCRVFSLHNGRIREGGADLTSDGQEIRNLAFTVADAAGLQPRVTTKFNVFHNRFNVSFDLQTTISQRNLNF